MDRTALYTPTALTVAIVGGGNGAHAAAGYLGHKKSLRVRVLTRRPHLWSSAITVNTKGSSWENRGDFVGKLQRVSSQPEDVIPGSDVVLLCAPANAHPELLMKIAPHVSQNTWVGTLYGQGGFDWAATEAFRGDWSRLDALFGFQNIPWLCRTSEYGKCVQMIGPKKQLWIAAWPPSKACAVAKTMSLLFDIPAESLPNFLTLTLSPSNQIIHPARYYGIFHSWDGSSAMSSDAIQWGLYTEMDDFSAEWLRKLDDELQAIRRGLEKEYPQLDLSRVLPLGERIVEQYGEDVGDRSCLRTIFATNKGYAGCKTPVQKVPGGFVPALQSRLFWEDIPYGLCVLKNIAQMLAIPTPSIDFMIEWHQQFMGRQYVINGRLNPTTIPETSAPEAYGIKDLDQLVRASLPCAAEGSFVPNYGNSDPSSPATYNAGSVASFSASRRQNQQPMSLAGAGRNDRQDSGSQQSWGVTSKL
eukprot:GHVQ01013082.1.p1 GENE.GHVQ01013082.1~~GHVQ01013082.1.p1  ORF type:complete len:472 (+),score=53.05 GHVQ01013082.1:484-1899(+)